MINLKLVGAAAVLSIAVARARDGKPPIRPSSSTLGMSIYCAID